jgi:hypothetical protein
VVGGWGSNSTTGAHLTHLPEPGAAGRVALTIRFLIASLSRWERDSQAASLEASR